VEGSKKPISSSTTCFLVRYLLFLKYEHFVFETCWQHVSNIFLKDNSRISNDLFLLLRNLRSSCSVNLITGLSCQKNSKKSSQNFKIFIYFCSSVNVSSHLPYTIISPRTNIPASANNNDVENYQDIEYNQFAVNENTDNCSVLENGAIVPEGGALKVLQFGARGS